MEGVHEGGRGAAATDDSGGEDWLQPHERAWFSSADEPPDKEGGECQRRGNGAEQGPLRQLTLDLPGTGGIINLKVKLLRERQTITRVQDLLAYLRAVDLGSVFAAQVDDIPEIAIGP